MGELKWPYPKKCYRLACKTVVDYFIEISKNRPTELRLPKWMVTSRLKADPSIREKLTEKKKAISDYNINCLTDLAGVRVVVESVQCVRALAHQLQQSKIFKIKETDTVDHLEVPREDGYRAMHLVLLVNENNREIPVELQIRTHLQHQWSQLSRREFYPFNSKIPQTIQESMRSLSDILHGVDKELEHIHRVWILDECRGKVSKIYRTTLFELLGGDLSEGKSAEIGSLGNILHQFELQLRRALLWRGKDQQFALETMKKKAEEIAGLNVKVGEEVQIIERRVRYFIEVLPVPEK